MRSACVWRVFWLRGVLAVLVGAAGVSAACAQWHVVMHDGRRFVPVQDVAAFYRMRQATSSEGTGFRLTASGRSIEGRAGARDIRINGVKYVLCFAMVKKDGKTLISAMDVTKIIEPVLRPQKIQNATEVRTVILDPGHGGHDSGAVGPLGREKDAALDVAQRARRLLESRGYRVRMTRSKDVFIPLEDRSAFANRSLNAVMVSIHFNKDRSGSGTGVETYCLAPRGVPSMDEEHMSYSDLKRHPGHARDPENIALATAIHSALTRRTSLPDRGIKRARFHVIRATTIPSILVEGGFMNSPTDSRLIASSAYRQQIAEAIASGVAAFNGAVTGVPRYQSPTAVVSAADSTNIPDLAADVSDADRDVAMAIRAASRAATN